MDYHIYSVWQMWQRFTMSSSKGIDRSEGLPVWWTRMDMIQMIKIGKCLSDSHQFTDGWCQVSFLCPHLDLSFVWWTTWMGATGLWLQVLNTQMMEQRCHSKFGECKELQSNIYCQSQACCTIEIRVPLLFQPCSPCWAVVTNLQACIQLQAARQFGFLAGSNQQVPWDNAAGGPPGNHKWTVNDASAKEFPSTTPFLSQGSFCGRQEMWCLEYGWPTTL